MIYIYIYLIIKCLKNTKNLIDWCAFLPLVRFARSAFLSLPAFSHFLFILNDVI